MNDKSLPVSVCIETLFKNEDFGKKIERVSELDFEAIEFWGWKDKNLERIKKKVDELDLTIAAITGSKTPLTDPEKTRESIKDIEKSLKVAQDIGSENLIITAGQEQEKREKICPTRKHR